MKTNEAIYKSPEWLKKYWDFNIKTGKDTDAYKSKKAAEDRERKRQKVEEERKRKEEQRKKEEHEFQILLNSIKHFLSSNYKNLITDLYCIGYNPRVIDNDVVMEFKCYGDGYGNIKSKIIFHPQYSIPTFDVEFKSDNKYFNYRVSGISYHDLVNTFYNAIKWWGNKGGTFRKRKDDNKKEQEFPPQKISRQFQQNELDPSKNRERRLNLLKQTLEGYERNLARTPEGSEKDHIRNEIANIKGRIEAMKKKKNEGYNHVMSFQIFEKQYNPTKDDYVTIIYHLTGEPVPVKILKVYPNNTYYVSFDVDGSTAKGAPNATIRNSDIISPYKPIRSPVGTGFISTNTNMMQVGSTTNVNHVSNDMYL
jgi:hypothetical protein